MEALMRPRRPALIGAAVLVAALAGCGGGSSGYPTGSGGQNPPPGGGQPPPPPSTSASIAVKNNFFDPSSTTVNVNTTVTWTWDSCTDDGYGGKECVEHNVTFAGGVGSGNKADGSYSRQFTGAGTFNYQCTIHGQGMSGQVVVR
jgi:plastocyanin